MKKLLFLVFFLSLYTEANAQLTCDSAYECRVTAPSGMRMRAQATTKSDVVASVPYDSEVIVCPETFGELTVDDINGYWRKVIFKSKVGYMFDGYLEILAVEGQMDKKFETMNTLEANEAKEDEEILVEEITLEKVEVVKTPSTNSTTFDLITEAFNYCGDINKLDPTLLWYGFYEAAEGTKYNRIRRVEVGMMLSKTKVGTKMEFDIETTENERSMFLIGLNRSLDIESLHIADPSEKLRYTGRKIYPGQEFILTEQDRYKLSATGSVSSSGPCPDLKDYNLIFSGIRNGEPVKLDIGKELQSKGQCGMPEIYWYGDFTGDGIPEIIFVSVYDEKNHFTLFLSDPSDYNPVLEKQSEWIIDKCY